MKRVSLVAALLIALLLPTASHAQQLRKIKDVLPGPVPANAGAKPCGEYFLVSGPEGDFSVAAVTGVEPNGDLRVAIMVPEYITIRVDDKKAVPTFEAAGEFGGILTMSTAELARSSSCMPKKSYGMVTSMSERELGKVETSAVSKVPGSKVCSEYFITTTAGSADGLTRLVAYSFDADKATMQAIHFLPEKWDVRVDPSKKVPTVELVAERFGTQRVILRISQADYAKAPCLPKPSATKDLF